MNGEYGPDTSRRKIAAGTEQLGQAGSSPNGRHRPRRLLSSDASVTHCDTTRRAQSGFSRAPLLGRRLDVFPHVRVASNVLLVLLLQYLDYLH